MTKKRKNRRKEDAVINNNSSKKNFNKNRALLILLSTLAAFVFYEAVLAVEEQAMLGFSIIMPVYISIVTVLICAVILFNHGFTKGDITPDMLRRDSGDTDEELIRICEKINSHKKISKKLMLVLFPFAISLLLDFIYLFYSDLFKSLISSWF